MPRLVAFVASAVLVAGAVTACGSGGDKEPSVNPSSGAATASATATSPSEQPTTSTPTATVDPNDGKEVLESKCADNPAVVGKRQPVYMVTDDKKTLKGILTIYSSSTCLRIFWAHFRPLPGSSSDFQVTITMDGKEYPTQDSIIDSPMVPAYTVGTRGQVGSKVVGCVMPMKKPASKVCMERPVP
jgi:hypothetical protein